MLGKAQKALFDERFIESYAGHSILKDPRIAVMELIANAWDASANEVQITWPAEHGDQFSIVDDGHGMNQTQFSRRFMTFGYQRLAEQGKYAEVVPGSPGSAKRVAFGKNAKGKFSIFLFGNRAKVRTWRDGTEHCYEVWPSESNGLSYKLVEKIPRTGHGTEIYVERAKAPDISADEIRGEIGMRFLTNPDFRVTVNGRDVEFADIPDENISYHELFVANIGKIGITVIDTQGTDRSTQQHGVAWWVSNRLVGECSWKGTGQEHLFDGRRTPARRYTFIVKADGLNAAGTILPDWSGFYPKNENYVAVREAVNDFVRDYIFALSKESRAETFRAIKSDNERLLNEMPLVSREKWEDFVQEVQKECQSITDEDLGRLSNILAKLETTDSKYGLIHQLSSMAPDSLEDLNTLLAKWDIDLAKIVLDELEGRLRLLEQLKLKVVKTETDEVMELQPLFHRGLWIFGPEYETIEYTSNEGMTTVIQRLFGTSETGSRLRPDFVVIPDGTVGLYTFPRFDEVDREEIGPERLTIVELKKPGIEIGKKEKDQPLSYIEELHKLGLIKDFTKVTCFVLGDRLNTFYSKEATEQGGSVTILPMTYETVIARAKSRSLRLYEKVRNAPFLHQTRVEEYLFERAQLELVDRYA